MHRRSAALGASLCVGVLVFAAPPARAFHSADTDTDWRLSLGEILRLVQFYNADGYRCADIHFDGATEDGYAPGRIEGQPCLPHDLDFRPGTEFWLDLTELLRAIQFFNSFGYCEGHETEDGYAPGLEVVEDEQAAAAQLLEVFLDGDINEDHRLTLEEAAALVDFIDHDLFDAWDSDGDGLLSRFEVYEVTLTPLAGGGAVPVITLTGAETITLGCGGTFVEPGYEATDAEDGDLTGAVRVSRLPERPRVGRYTLRYLVRDSDYNRASATRTVVFEDLESPVITLKGDANMVVECGDRYAEPGYEVTDACADGDPQVTTGGDYISYRPALGHYERTYEAVDAAGNHSAIVIRTIDVVDTMPPVFTNRLSQRQYLGIGQVPDTRYVTASDACGGSGLPITVGSVPETPGDYAIPLTAVDARGNEGTEALNVTVLDSPNPVATVILDYDWTIGNYCPPLISPAPIAGSVEAACFAVPLDTVLTLTGDGASWCTYVAAANGSYVGGFSVGTSLQITVDEPIVVLNISDYSWGEGEGEYWGGEGEGEGEAGGEGEGEGEGETEGEDQGPDYENPFVRVSADPLSTFSIDVDTGSYSLVRRYLQSGYWPPTEEIRIEELLNYFSYSYPSPTDDEPFSVYTEVADCPWAPDHRLMHIGLQTRRLAWEERPPSNFVLLIDVSGSMYGSDRLPLIKQALHLLVEEFLDERDRLAIVTYSNTHHLLLDSRPCTQQYITEILGAIDSLNASGSTHASAGLEVAYRIARDHFITGGINRVILSSDGDFNVGITNRDSLIAFIQEKARSGVYLTTMGYGFGNLRDDLMEGLADNGNGNYAYIDTMAEAQKVLVDELTATLIPVASDVKIQVEFNAATVDRYRLIGYENRRLGDHQFNNDRVDAGEIGQGHSVTALYELIPTPEGLSPAYEGGPVPCMIDIRHKPPASMVSLRSTTPVQDGLIFFDESTPDFSFAASVAAFGMLLRHSIYSGSADFAMALDVASASLGPDPFDRRAEYLNLVQRAITLGGRAASAKNVETISIRELKRLAPKAMPEPVATEPVTQR